MTAFLMTKFKNMIKRENPENNYTFNIRNTNINGVKVGCYGFITNNDNGSVVCINTEDSCMNLGYLYRYADNINDHHGYRNNFAKTPIDLVCNVIKMLEKTPKEAKEIRI